MSCAQKDNEPSLWKQRRREQRILMGMKGCGQQTGSDRVNKKGIWGERARACQGKEQGMGNDSTMNEM